MSNWYKDNNIDNNIAVSSRIRLARNLKGFPFPARMTNEQRKELNLKVKEALLGSNTPFAKSLKYIDMANVPDTQKYAMVERHIISPEFANKSDDPETVYTTSLLSVGSTSILFIILSPFFVTQNISKQL